MGIKVIWDSLVGSTISALTCPPADETSQLEIDMANKPKDTEPNKEGYYLRFFKSPQEMSAMYSQCHSCMGEEAHTNYYPWKAYKLTSASFYAYWPKLYGVALWQKISSERHVQHLRRFCCEEGYSPTAYGSRSLDGIMYSLLSSVGYKKPFAANNGLLLATRPMLIPGTLFPAGTSIFPYAGSSIAFKEDTYAFPVPYNDFWSFGGAGIYKYFNPETKVFSLSPKELLKHTLGLGTNVYGRWYR